LEELLSWAGAETEFDGAGSSSEPNSRASTPTNNNNTVETKSNVPTTNSMSVSKSPAVDKRVQHATKLKKIHDTKRRHIRRKIVGLARTESKQDEDNAYEVLRPSRYHESQIIHHGGDTDASGHLSLEEVNVYRQVMLLSPDPENHPVDIIDVHYANHIFGEYEVMINETSRQHTVECRGVVIAFFINKNNFKKLMDDYPVFEQEMWKRAAVTAIKVCSVDDMYNFRYEATRNIRKAFQKGTISTPSTRICEAEENLYSIGHFNIKNTNFQTKEAKVELLTPSDHLFFIKKKVGTNRILSGPLKGNQSIVLSGEDVCIIFHLPSTHALDSPLTENATNVATLREEKQKVSARNFKRNSAKAYKSPMKSVSLQVKKSEFIRRSTDLSVLSNSGENDKMSSKPLSVDSEHRMLKVSSEDDVHVNILEK
jgi:hypothetical protein